MYDPESPIQDADIDMVELQHAAGRIAKLEKRGICTHGWVNTSHGVKCNDCGKCWDTEAEWMQEYKEILL